jgi:replicative DNA helicase
MQVFVVCSAAAIIFLVCRCILFGCGYDEEDRDYTSRPYWASPSHNESFISVSSARAKSTLRILEHGRKESRSSISPHAERVLVTALANRLLSDESKNLTAEDLRERARNMRQDHQEALKRANRAYKKGDYAAAARHKRDVREIQSSMELLNRLAAEVTFIKKNKVRNCITTSEMR